MRRLVAEDAADSRWRLSLIVEGLGYEELTASDGAETWEPFDGTLGVGAVTGSWSEAGLDGPPLIRWGLQACVGEMLSEYESAKLHDPPAVIVACFLHFTLPPLRVGVARIRRMSWEVASKD